MNPRFFLAGIILVSCGPSKKEQVSEMKLVAKTDSAVSKDSVFNDTSFESDYENQFKLDTYLVQADIDTSDLQEISESVALLIYPTDEQIEEMKKEYGEEDFYTVADDAQFYQGTAIGMIDSLGIKTITAERRFIRFQGGESSWTLDIRGKNALDWGIIVFDKNKKPEIISAIDLTNEKIVSYFDL